MQRHLTHQRKLLGNYIVSKRLGPSYMQTKRTTWRFNLERAPWWGGVFERMVRRVKRCLRKTLGNARLTLDERNTVLVEVEGTLNARPLTDEYEEFDGEILTPSHLIYGRAINIMPISN
jgi:truncated hemoglobin YjbI